MAMAAAAVAEAEAAVAEAVEAWLKKQRSENGRKEANTMLNPITELTAGEFLLFYGALIAATLLASWWWQRTSDPTAGTRTTEVAISVVMEWGVLSDSCDCCLPSI